MNIKTSINNLINTLKDNNSTDAQINHAIGNYYEALNQCDDEQAVANSMQALSHLFSLDNLRCGATASLICGSLIESGYSAAYIIDDYINFFKHGIDKALPFIKACENKLAERNNNIDEENYKFIERQKQDLKPKYTQSINALNALDSYYLCGIAIFTSSKTAFNKGKEELSEVTQYADYSIGFSWLAKLFSVLFNEPVIVIDLNSKKGIKGEMNGIVENGQLQLLLMGLPELNDTISVPEAYTNVANGLGEQVIEGSFESQWNMYNWEYLVSADEDSLGADNQIWSEGKPGDISTFNAQVNDASNDDATAYRIILLDKPSYQRTLPIQRTYKSLPASIVVKEVLTANQVEAFISEIKN